MARNLDSNMRPAEAEAVIVKVSPRGDTPPQAADEAAEMAAATAAKKPGFFRFLSKIAIALFALWLYSLSAPYVRLALEHEGWRSWVAWGAAAVPFAAAFIILAALKAYFRLPAMAKFEQGRKSTYEFMETLLKKYVRRYPVKSEAFEEAAGEKAAAIRDAFYAIPALENGTGDWKAAFDAFLAQLDARAADIVRATCKGIGLKTAANPWKILDIAIVACNSTTMVCSLATLYNRRMSSREGFSFVCRYFANVYISGEAGAAAQGMADAVSSQVGAGASTPDWLVAALPFASKVAGKVAEGGVNAFLAYRLGQYAIKALRPVGS